jgi:hypothetical protein
MCYSYNQNNLSHHGLIIAACAFAATLDCDWQGVENMSQIVDIIRIAPHA